MVDAALRIIPEAYRDKVRSIDARHANRLLFSAFAVAALWISSLSVSTSLAELVVSTPTGQDVKSTCDFTHRAIKEQKRNYAHCIKTQLGRCEVDYAEALAREILKTSVRLRVPS